MDRYGAVLLSAGPDHRERGVSNRSRRSLAGPFDPAFGGVDRLRSLPVVWVLSGGGLSGASADRADPPLGRSRRHSRRRCAVHVRPAAFLLLLFRDLAGRADVHRDLRHRSILWRAVQAFGQSLDLCHLSCGRKLVSRWKPRCILTNGARTPPASFTSSGGLFTLSCSFWL